MQESIRAGDLEVAYRLEGPQEAPVVMLVHGIMTSRRMWDDAAALLRERWRVLRYDLRGHGGTQVTEPPYLMHRLADDAIALLDALGLEKVHFICSSLGGMIGQQIGARYGERVLTLALANTSSVQRTPAAWAQRIDVAGREGMSGLVESTLQRWFTEPYLAVNGQPVRRLREIAMTMDPRGFVGCACAVQQLAQADLLARIEVPTLIVAGSEDRATPIAESQALVEGIAGARMVTLPAAHQSAVECAELFVRAWEGFVNNTFQETNP